MTVDADSCLRFLREVRDVAFATVDEDGLPAVRVIDVMMVEGGRLYFVAARGKAFYGQVMRTRYVAIVGQSPDYRTCRLRGPVEHPDDPVEQRRLVDRVFELNPSMEELYPGDSRYVLEAFYLERGQGEFFDLAATPSSAHRSRWAAAPSRARASRFRTPAPAAVPASRLVHRAASRRGPTAAPSSSSRRASTAAAAARCARRTPSRRGSGAYLLRSRFALLFR